MHPPPSGKIRRLPIVVILAACLGVCGWSCGGTEKHLDALQAVERGEIGRSVLGFRWKRVLSEYASEPNPQEFASPVVRDNVLFVGSHEGTFYALSTGDGSIRWKRALGSVSSRPLLHLGSLFVGTDDGVIVCLDSLQGKQKWRYKTNGAILQTPVIVGDTLLLSNETDYVYALDRNTGKVRWKYHQEPPKEFTLRGHAGVAVGGDMVFAGFANGSLAALRIATGTVAWITSLGASASRFVDVDSTPIVMGNRIYAASSGGGLYALQTETGDILWRAPVLHVGGIVVEETRIFAASANTGIYALDSQGTILWQQSTFGGGEPAPPILVGEYLVYTLSEDGVFVSDKNSGRLHQFFNPGTGISSPPLYHGGNFYLLSNAGILYAMTIQ